MSARKIANHADRTPATTYLWDGSRNEAAPAGQSLEVEAKAGIRYRLSRKDGDGASHKIDRLVALRDGKDDLVLLLDDSSRIVVKNFFKVCAGAACSIELPGESGLPVVLDGDAHGKSVAAGDAQLIYSVGDAATTLELVESYARFYDAHPAVELAGDTAPDSASSHPGWMPLAGILGALGGLGAMLGGGGSSGGGSPTPGDNGTNGGGATPGGNQPGGAQPLPTLRVTGNVVAGPVVPGHQLSIAFFNAEGAMIAGPVRLNDDGTFDVKLPAGYAGVAVGRVFDGGDGADYFDEATGLPVDLGGDLRLLFVADGASESLSATISPLTELAVRYAETLAGGGQVSPDLAKEANHVIAEAFGIVGDLYQTAVPVVGVNGEISSSANYVGKILAALSGLQASLGEDTYLSAVIDSVVSNASAETAALLATGATIVDRTLPGGALLATLGAASPAIAAAAAEIERFDATLATMQSDEIGALAPYRFAALSAKAAGALTAEQVGALSAAQLAFFSVDALEAMDTSAVTLSQMARLGAAQLRALYDIETSSLTMEAYPGFTVDATPDVTGSAALPIVPGVTVAIYDGAQRIGAATVSPDRESWSFTPDVALLQGTHTLTARLEFSDGKASEFSPSFELVVRDPLSLNADEIKLVPAKEVSSISVTVLADYSSDQLGAFSATQVNAMTADQISAFYGADISAAYIDGLALPADKPSRTGSVELRGTMRVAVPEGASLLLAVLDGEEQVGFVSVSGTSWTIALPHALADGSHRLALKLETMGKSIIADHLDLSVDTVAPSIASVAIDTIVHPVATALTAGDGITFVVRYSEAVTVDTTNGVPTLSVDVGGQGRVASYLSGSGTAELRFVYRIVEGDNDTDGISIEAGRIDTQSGSIRDQAGNAAMSDHAALAAVPALTVDTISTAVVDVTVTGSVSNRSVLALGDSIFINVTLDEELFINVDNGLPTLQFTLGGATRSAAFQTGADANKHSMLFRYDIVEGDTASDGIVIGTNPLSFNGASIREKSGRPAVVTLENELHSALKVDTVAPTALSVELARGDAGSGPLLKAGDTISASVRFSEVVSLEDASYPVLALVIGNQTVDAVYFGGSGSDTLVFHYIIPVGAADADGVSLAPTAILLNGSRIVDIAGQPYVPASGLSAGGAVYTVDGVQPTILSAPVLTREDGETTPLIVGDKISVAVSFSEIVVVSGAPWIALKLGDKTVHASYDRGSGSDQLIFVYTIAEGDVAPAGIEILSNGITQTGGQIVDAAGNAADLTHVAVAPLAGFVVDAKPPLVVAAPTLERADHGTAPLDVGAVISISVTFDDNVFVRPDGQQPHMRLMIGGIERIADYSEGSGTKTLLFTYVVAEGDYDDDGIDILGGQAGGLSADAGSISDAAGNTAILTHDAVPASMNFRVSTVVPQLLGIFPRASDPGHQYLKVGSELTLEAVFSQSVIVDQGGGAPVLKLLMNGTERLAQYIGGSGTKALTFRYIVAEDDGGTYSVELPDTPLELRGAAIHDAMDKDAALTSEATRFDTILVDTQAPAITDLTIEAPDANDGFSGVGDRLWAIVSFDDVVTIDTVGGQAAVKLDIGGTERLATYISGSGTTSLKFEYVISADVDLNGVTAPEGFLSLMGAVIRDYAGNSAPVNGTGEALTTDLKVDTQSPRITGVAIVDADGAVGQVLKTMSVVRFDVTFDKVVRVDETHGTPELTVDVGGVARKAIYVSGSDSQILRFAYEIAYGDEDKDGISLPAVDIATGGGAIRDIAGNDAVLSHSGAAADINFQVDSIPAFIDGIDFDRPATDRWLTVGDAIIVNVHFSDPVMIDTSHGTPGIEIDLGGTKRLATYLSGSDSSTLRFQYLVVAGDVAMDGISLDAGTLILNGATIRDALSYAASDTYNGVEHDFAVRVDAARPQVTSVIASGISTGAAGWLREGDEAVFHLQFDSNVTVDTQLGQPLLSIMVGDVQRQAYYVGGSGTSKLEFRYEITEFEHDTDGISIVGQNFTTNGGKIVDAAGNETLSTLPQTSVYADLKVDAEKPTITDEQISTRDGGTLDDIHIGDVLDIRLNFSEAMTFDFGNGNPSVSIKLGGADVIVSEIAGTGSNYLDFTYAVTTEPATAEFNYTGFNIGNARLTDIAGNHLVLA